MNVVTIKLPDKWEMTTHPTHHAMLNDKFRELDRSLENEGARLSGGPNLFASSFLISTQKLLSALRLCGQMRPEISMQVFALKAPEEQLIETVTLANQDKPESYSVIAEAPPK